MSAWSVPCLELPNRRRKLAGRGDGLGELHGGRQSAVGRADDVQDETLWDGADEEEEEEQRQVGGPSPDNRLSDVEEPPDTELARVQEELERESDHQNDTFLELGSPEITNDPVRMYLREIGRVNLLSEEEEKSLARRVQRGIQGQKHLISLEFDPTRK